MPHQCLNCNATFDNTSNAIIKGCPHCGGKLFLFIKKLPTEEKEIELTTEAKEILLKEVEQFIDTQNIDKPIILQLENVRVVGSGKYEIDINQLFKKEKPIIYKVQEGTYVIDLNFLKPAENANKD